MNAGSVAPPGEERASSIDIPFGAFFFSELRTLRSRSSRLFRPCVLTSEQLALESQSPASLR
jgi:hypothetical protein